MIPLALIVVIAIVGSCLLVATGVLVYRLHVNRTRLYDEKDDIEAAEPVRKLRVSHGRVVSTASTVFTPAFKAAASRFSSRPSSIRTEDLEEDIKAYQRDYPPLPRDSDGNIIGIPPDRKPLQPISESEHQSPKSPARVHRPKSRTRTRVMSTLPETDIAESSWKTYNGHRGTDDVLSSPLGPLPRLDLDIKLPADDKPQLTKWSSSEARRAAKQVLKTQQSSKTIETPRTQSVPEVVIQADIPTNSSKISQTQKPAKLSLESASKDELDYGFPSPPLSAGFLTTPVKSSSDSLHGQAEQLYVVSPQTSFSRMTSICVSDIESRPSRTTTRRGRSSVHSRSSSRSRQRSRSEHRVRKRPAPIKTTLVTPSSLKPESPSEADTQPDSVSFLSTPTQSEAPPSFGRFGSRKNTRLSVQTFASSDLSPTFSVAPVFRVPLYAGKTTGGSHVKIIGGKNRKGSQNSQRPSILRTQTAPFLNQDGSGWPPPDICTLLKQGFTIAQSLDPMTDSPSASPLVVIEEQPSAQPQQSLASKGSYKQRSGSVPGDATLTQMTTHRDPSDNKSSHTSAKDDSKHSKTHLSVQRPSLSQARSLSGNITLSAAQTKAHSQRNTANSSASTANQATRRSRYEHLVEEKRRSTLTKSSSQKSASRKTSTTSLDEMHNNSVVPMRKGSLPARLPDDFGPPDPKVLSKILGLTPPSPKVNVMEVPSSASPAAAVFEISASSPNTPHVPTTPKNARGVGHQVQSRKGSVKKQVLGGGKEPVVSITTKELELDRVANDMSLMSSGFAVTGMRRGAISTNDVAL